MGDCNHKDQDPWGRCCKVEEAELSRDRWQRNWNDSMETISRMRKDNEELLVELDKVKELLARAEDIIGDHAPGYTVWLKEAEQALSARQDSQDG